jgi:Lrp/AsnC family transcriptional regulator for asnA, asnC and gidA
MDELDDKILEKLNEGTRKSYREISGDLNISLPTASNRIKRMEDEKVIERYIPLVNQEKIGYGLTAVIIVKISHGKLLKGQERISKINMSVVCMAS